MSMSEHGTHQPGSLLPLVAIAGQIGRQGVECQRTDECTRINEIVPSYMIIAQVCVKVVCCWY